MKNTFHLKVGYFALQNTSLSNFENTRDKLKVDTQCTHFSLRAPFSDTDIMKGGSSICF